MTAALRAVLKVGMTAALRAVKKVGMTAASMVGP
jgi:hypothetical protein